MKPATAKTLSLLQHHGSKGLSTLELRAQGINSPAARVLELRNVYEIDSHLCWDSDQQMITRRVMKYFYIGQRHEAY